MCSCDQSLVTLAFLWEKLSQSQFRKDLTRKTAFFERWSWFKFNNLKLALGKNVKFYSNVAKGLKLKIKFFWTSFESADFSRSFFKQGIVLLLLPLILLFPLCTMIGVSEYVCFWPLTEDIWQLKLSKTACTRLFEEWWRAPSDFFISLWCTLPRNFPSPGISSKAQK